MTETTCSVGECGRAAKKRGYCYSHYNRWLYTGAPEYDMKPITDEASARAAINAGKCPYCGRGPFRVVAGHAQRAHGVDRRQLREDAGLSWSTSVCDPEHAERMRQLSIENDRVRNMQGKHVVGVRNPMSPAGRAALADAGRQYGRRQRVSVADHPEIQRRFGLGESPAAIAGDFGCSASRIRQIAKAPA